MAEKYRSMLWLGLGAFLLAAGIFWRGAADYGMRESMAEPSADQNAGPRIALTFDDGPSSRYTKPLLDGLRERDVKASFFLMGRNIPGNEELVRQMHEDGHLIGNHTYDHVQLTKLSEEEACRQIQQTSDLIYEITGEYTTFVRPPFGEWREGLDCAVTMLPVSWTVDPVDWNTEDTDLVVRRVEEAAGDEDIILLHDCSASSVEAALRIVDDLSEQGYEFVTVEKLLLE